MIQTEARAQTRWPLDWERRGILRHDLEPMGLVTLLSEESGNEYLCTMRNLSKRGMMVEFCCIPPEILKNGMAEGQHLIVAGVDEALQDLVDGRQVKVLWQEGEFSGLLFSEELPLDNETLGRTLEEQRLLAWDEWRP